MCEGGISNSEDSGSTTVSPNIVVPEMPDLVPTSTSGQVDPSSILSTGSYNFENPDDVKKFYEQASPADIRSALLKAGMSKEQLDKIDDAALKQFFSQTLESASQSGQLDALVKTKTEDPQN